MKGDYRILFFSEQYKCFKNLKLAFSHKLTNQITWLLNLTVFFSPFSNLHKNVLCFVFKDICTL